MTISEVMTKTPSFTRPNSNVEEVARLMVTCDCGSVPVVDGERVVGIVTDRDIVVRAVAAGKCPLDLKVKDLMSHPVATVNLEDDISKAVTSLQDNQVRRIPVVDGANRLVGIISQADLARTSPVAATGTLLQEISNSIDIGHS